MLTIETTVTCDYTHEYLTPACSKADGTRASVKTTATWDALTGEWDVIMPEGWYEGGTYNARRDRRTTVHICPACQVL